MCQWCGQGCFWGRYFNLTWDADGSDRATFQENYIYQIKINV